MKLLMVAFALLLLGSGCTSSAAPTQTQTLAQGEAIAMVKRAIPASSTCVGFKDRRETAESAWTESYDRGVWTVGLGLSRTDSDARAIANADAKAAYATAIADANADAAYATAIADANAAYATAIANARATTAAIPDEYVFTVFEHSGIVEQIEGYRHCLLSQ